MSALPLDEEEELPLDEDERLLPEEDDERPLEDDEPLLDRDEEPPLDGEGPVHPAVGSPTFPAPALASASAAAPFKACAVVGSLDIKQQMPISQLGFYYTRT